MSIMKNYYFLVAKRKNTELTLLNSFFHWRSPLTEIWVHNATIRDPQDFLGEEGCATLMKKVKTKFEGGETRPLA